MRNTLIQRLCIAMMALMMVTMAGCKHAPTAIQWGEFEYHDTISDGHAVLELDFSLCYPKSDDVVSQAIYDTLMHYIFDSIYTKSEPIDSTMQHYYTQLWNEIRSLREEEGPNDLPDYLFDWMREVRLEKLMSNDYLVVTGCLYGEYSGGAHPNYAYILNVFDAQTGVPMHEKDIFVAGSEDALNALLLQELPNSPEFTAMEDYWEEALYLNDNFAVTEKGLEYTFNPYEIACYAQGSTTVTFTKEQLKPYLNTNTTLYRYWFNK